MRAWCGAPCLRKDFNPSSTRCRHTSQGVVVRLDVVADQAERTRLVGRMMMTGLSHRSTTPHKNTRTGLAHQIYFIISSLNMRMQHCVAACSVVPASRAKTTTEKA